MTLWNIIRDFFVQYVFGGVASNGELFNLNFFGQLASKLPDGGINYFDTFNTGFFIPLNGVEDSGDNYISYISFADWLSTTATIITLIGLFIAITMFIIKLVKWISNTIAMR